MLVGSIITKNEEEWISTALSGLSFIPRVILVDNGSTDQTLEMARTFKNVDIKQVNINLPHCVGEQRNISCRDLPDDTWIYFSDGDEYLTDELRQEIEKLTDEQISSEMGAYFVPRLNIHLGQPLKHGGWYPDYQVRLIRKSALVQWVNGPLDLPPVIFEDQHGYLKETTYGPHDKPLLKSETKVGYLHHPYLHFNHRSINSMLSKTPRFLDSELNYLKECGQYSTPGLIKMTWVPLKEFCRRYILKAGFLDGRVGLIESMYMAFSAFLFEARKWESFSTPTVEEKYTQLKEKYSHENSK